MCSKEEWNLTWVTFSDFTSRLRLYSLSWNIPSIVQDICINWQYSFRPSEEHREEGEEADGRVPRNDTSMWSANAGKDRP